MGEEQEKEGGGGGGEGGVDSETEEWFLCHLGSLKGGGG